MTKASMATPCVSRAPHGRLALMLGVALCLSAGFAPAVQDKVVTVTRKTAKLRAEARFFAPPVTDLVEGDRLGVLETAGAWHRVSFKNLVGWVQKADVTEKRDVRLSGQGVRENYSAAETAAARKGFNPQVEREYQKSNPDLEAAYRKVDAIQARVVPDAEMERFLRDGGLLREGR